MSLAFFTLLQKYLFIFSFKQNFYSERFGASNLVMIKDSNPVDVTKLNIERAYIQITYVEPYFDVSELRHRVTVFERNYNISTLNFKF